MKTIQEFNEQKQLAELYPALVAIEEHLKAKGIEPDQYFENAFELKFKEELLNEFDPLTGALGAYGAYNLGKSLWNKAGGWQGIKNVAQQGWSDLKQTGRNLKATHQANQIAGNRQHALDSVQKVGGSVSLPSLAPTRPAEVQNQMQALQQQIQQLSSDPALSGDPQTASMIKQLNQALANLKRRTEQLPKQQIQRPADPGVGPAPPPPPQSRIWTPPSYSTP